MFRNLRLPQFRLPKLLRSLQAPLAIGLGGLLLTALLQPIEFNLIESQLYDLRMRRSVVELEPSRDVVLISLDDVTSRVLGEPAPIGMENHARFLETLARSYQPRGVGYLADLNAAQESEVDAGTSAGSHRFVHAAQALQARGTPVLLGTRFGYPSEILPPYPLSLLPHALAVVHRDGNVFPEDKVTRRALVSLYGRPAFHTELLRRLQGAEFPPAIRGTFPVPEAEGEYFFFRYRGDPGGSTPLQTGFQRYSFSDLLEGLLPAEAINGKVLLVGSENREDASDYTYTPFAKGPFAGSRLQVHAQILNSMLQDSGIRRVAPLINFLLTFVCAAFVLWCVLRSTPLFGVSATLLMAAGVVLVGQIAFSAHGLWVRQSHPLVAIFLGYYLVVPFRLLHEHQKRWDYQRKNEVLLQVEELKRNFLSLVTHDLKTPVARIQGLAELLSRKASKVLGDSEKENLKHIFDATEDLNRFISSILELSKVESSKLRLQLESKDINTLIERCAQTLEAAARSKAIQIDLHLEPLFPIRLDPGLVSKVLNNLIDNAIKYSPAGSAITIRSREEGDFVEITVQDQGIGLSVDEQSQLFQRFYRAKNDTTTRTSGTGLGLYLTRFFVEAHGGTVTVESTPGQGSAFRIRLPQSLPADFEAPGLTIQKPGGTAYATHSRRG